MANTYTALHYHVVFSTKNREPWITTEHEQRLWSYLGGIARENEMKPLMIGGIENHVHMLLGIPPALAVSKAVQLVKGGSSAWMKETMPGMSGFGWQDGYGAFTVSKSHVPEVAEYVGSQRQHHRGRTFEQEYRALLERHGIEFDERYIFDSEIVGEVSRRSTTEGYPPKPWAEAHGYRRSVAPRRVSFLAFTVG